MKRRSFVALSAGALAAPYLARAAERSSTLKFVPQADLSILDPIQINALVTRNHAMMVFDTLYGADSNFVVQPQMAVGHVVSADGLQWDIRLRDGLKFHDNSPVLARDCVASILRWGKRDVFGLTLMAATDSVTAPDDKTIRFRLKKPFPLLPDALGKSGVNLAAMMPERLAQTDAFKAVPEIVGSGPYRFLAEERVVGSLAVYAKFDGYQPRKDGVSSFLAGPRIAYFDRVEWHTMPDASTAAGALQLGEIDWWEQPSIDLLPLLRRNGKIKVELVDTAGSYTFMRPNHLQPPFDNPAIRRALMGAINQTDFMQAACGDEKDLWRDKVGFFLPGSPMASDAGISALTGPRDLGRVKSELAAAGYKGERVVLLVPTDVPLMNALSEIAADMLRKLGMNLDYQAMDWGTVLQRLNSREPVEHGGWSLFCTWAAGAGIVNPAAHSWIRGLGTSSTFGWPTSSKLEQLRDQWFEAPSPGDQKRICAQMQTAAFEDVPYYPTGVVFQPTAYRTSLTGMQRGAPIFTGVRPAGT